VDLPAREHADTPVSCADTEPEHELESDTGERAGAGRDPDDTAPGYSPRYNISHRLSLAFGLFNDALSQ
jgi:hypothetical protein